MSIALNIGTVAHMVEDSPEFRRVLALPRRDWRESIQANDLHKRITAAFRLPTGQQELRLIQAAALADAHDQRGLLAPVRVGEGKTLLSFLLPVVVQNIKRPTLLLPAALVEKTWREFHSSRDPRTGQYTALQRHWLCHPDFATRSRFDAAVITYEKLGRDSGKDRLDERLPDMLIADECHKLRNLASAACAKRVSRYMLAHPETVFCGMSGTITKRTLGDYWHLLYWALREKMPLPRTEAEMERWAEALDERRVDVLNRRDPGVLMNFCTDEEREKLKPKRSAPLGRTGQMPFFVGNLTEKLTLARQGYQRRLRESSGVICSPDENLACSLIIKRQPHDPGPVVAKHLEKLRGPEPTTPNGDLLATPMEVWRHARELSCGFFYRWDPAAPVDWMVARKRWNWYVRQILTPGNSAGNPNADPYDGILHDEFKYLHLDSPMQVALAVTQEKIVRRDIVEAYKAWEAVRDSFKINSVAQWVSDSTIDFCVQWVKDNGKAIIWVEHRAYGERLAQKLGTGFCSNGGMDAAGKLIEDYAGATVVASVAANKEGRNLQAWCRNLVVTAPPTGSLWEQMIGRTHRPGQEEDTVYVDWLAACAEQDDGFHQLMADAQYIQDTTGQSQKLLYADHV